MALGASQDDGEELDLEDGEVLIRKGKANHFVGSISDGGRLRLTTAASFSARTGSTSPGSADQSRSQTSSTS